MCCPSVMSEMRGTMATPVATTCFSIKMLPHVDHIPWHRLEPFEKNEIASLLSVWHMKEP